MDNDTTIKIDDLRLIAATHMMAGFQVPLAMTIDTLAREKAGALAFGCRGQQAGVSATNGRPILTR